MQLTRLELLDFRNYERLEIAPGPGLTAFVGSNAQGKSNLLEAVAMLGTGKSFRTTRDADTVRIGSDLAVVRGEAEYESPADQVTLHRIVEAIYRSADEGQEIRL